MYMFPELKGPNAHARNEYAQKRSEGGGYENYRERLSAIAQTGK